MIIYIVMMLLRYVNKMEQIRKTVTAAVIPSTDVVMTGMSAKLQALISTAVKT